MGNKLQINQCKNSENVIIENKNNYVFYLSSLILLSFIHLFLKTSVELRFALQKAMSKSRMKKKIIIYHYQKSLLFYKYAAWKIKNSDSCFDVTMGSYGDPELCEFIGIYLLSSYVPWLAWMTVDFTEIISKMVSKKTSWVRKLKNSVRKAEGDFKQLYYDHKKSFRNQKMQITHQYQNTHQRMKNKHNASLMWCIVKSVPDYSNIQKKISLQYESRHL